MKRKDAQVYASRHLNALKAVERPPDVDPEYLHSVLCEAARLIVERLTTEGKQDSLMAMSVPHPLPHAVFHWGCDTITHKKTMPSVMRGQWVLIHGAKLERPASIIAARTKLDELMSLGLAPPETQLFECCPSGLIGAVRFTHSVGGLGKPVDPSDPWPSSPFGWKIGEARVFDAPIPCRGYPEPWHVQSDVRPFLPSYLLESLPSKA